MPADNQRDRRRLPRDESRAKVRCTSSSTAITGQGPRVQHLRATPLLRGLPARAAVHRGTGHHRTHLRHLPGCVSDQLGQRHGACRRRRPSIPQIRQLRRLLYFGEWIESHTLHVVHAPRARLPRLPERDRDGGKDSPGCGDERAAAEEAGQLDHDRRRRARDPPDQHSRRRLLPLPDESRRSRPFTPRAEVGLEVADSCPRWTWSQASSSRTSSMDYEFVALRIPTSTPSSTAASCPTGGLDIDVSEWRLTSRSSTSSGRTPSHARIKERGRYHVGPMARFTINHDNSDPEGDGAAAEKSVSAPRRSESLQEHHRSSGRDRPALRGGDLRIIERLRAARSAGDRCGPRGSGRGPRLRARRPAVFAVPPYEIDAVGMIEDARSCRRPPRIRHRSRKI